MTKRNMLNEIRSVLYSSAKLLGDLNAIEKNKVPRRITRRIAGKITGRILGKIFG